eukprot:8241384-Pyramimonas_sp.AAC.2
MAPIRHVSRVSSVWAVSALLALGPPDMGSPFAQAADELTARVTAQTSALNVVDDGQHDAGAVAVHNDQRDCRTLNSKLLEVAAGRQMLTEVIALAPKVSSCFGADISGHVVKKLPQLRNVHVRQARASSPYVQQNPHIQECIKLSMAVTPLYDFGEWPDDGDVRLHRHLLDDDDVSAGRGMTKCTAADVYGGDRRTYGTKVCKLAAVLIYNDRIMREMLECSVTQAVSASELVCYVDCSMYDETPMPLNTPEL